MYLALLSKEEKENFLGMAYNLAVVDGNYSDDEKALMEAYCQELKCTFDETTMVKPEDVLVDYIKKNSTNTVKRIFIFELIGLAMADGNYDETERNMISRMIKEYNIDDNYAKECEKMLDEYLILQRNLNNLVLG